MPLDFDATTAAAQANDKCAAAVAALDPGSTIAIIGAGMSHPAFPLWPALAKQVCTACGYKGTPTPHPRTFQAARDKNPLAHAKFLKRMFSTSIIQIRLSLLYLMRLKFRAYVTTNFDSTVIRAAQCVYAESVGVYAYPEHPDPQDLDQQQIVFIHGRCAELFDKDANNLVLHFEAYRRAYIDPTVPLVRFFRGLLSNYNCLFIGTSLTDPPLQYLLQKIALDGAPAEKSRVLLTSSKAFAANTVDEFEIIREVESTQAGEWKGKNSIDLLRYAPLTSRHDGLESVLRTACETRRSLPASRTLAMTGVPESAFNV